MIGKYNSPDFFKVHEFRPATLFKTLAQEFSCKFCAISKNNVFTEHLHWLFLNLHLQVLRTIQLS